MIYPSNYIPCAYCSGPNSDWPGRYKHDPKYPSCFTCKDKVDENKTFQQAVDQVPAEDLPVSFNAKGVNKR